MTRSSDKTRQLALWVCSASGVVSIRINITGKVVGL
jgi:hypothetical protein